MPPGGPRRGFGRSGLTRPPAAAMRSAGSIIAHPGRRTGGGMRSTRLGLVLAAGAVGLAAGCVDRRFLVETNVPGAQVYVDGKPIGATPADAQWEYAGYRRFT